MRKLLLLLVLVTVMAFNYRLVSLDYGFVQIPMKETNVIEAVELLLDVKEIVYYDLEFNISEGDKIVVVYTENNGSILYVGNDDVIDGLNLLGLLSDNYKPTKIAPFSYYIYLGIAAFILIIPMKGKKNK